MRQRFLDGQAAVRVTGEDRVRFLNGMFTNDVTRLAPGQDLHAAILTVKGKLLGNLRILCDEDSLLLDVPAAARDKILGNLDKHIIVDDVALEAVGHRWLEVQGPTDSVAQALGVPPPAAVDTHVRDGELVVARLRALGGEALRIAGPEARLEEISARLAALGATPLDETEAEALRIAAGEPRYGVDMGEDHMPLEARLDDAVSTTKGCYMGQEVIARLTARGHVNKQLVGLRLDGEGPAAAGARLSAEGRAEAGSVTSSAVHATLGPIALGYLHRSLWAPGTEVLVEGAAGAPPRRATVVPLPMGALGA